EHTRPVRYSPGEFRRQYGTPGERLNPPPPHPEPAAGLTITTSALRELQRSRPGVEVAPFRRTGRDHQLESKNPFLGEDTYEGGNKNSRPGFVAVERQLRGGAIRRGGRR